jgi:hypothetical protein
MKIRQAIKQLTVVLSVLATLIIANVGIALDYHDLDALPLSACPVCEFSHVLSFGEYSLQEWSIPVSFCLTDLKCPVVKAFAQNTLSFSNPQNRAPPNFGTV